jgi:hypothetical protein
MRLRLNANMCMGVPFIFAQGRYPNRAALSSFSALVDLWQPDEDA